MKRLMIVLVLAAAIAAPAAAQAPQARGGRGRMMMGRGGPLAVLRGLNLTDDQRQQVKAILDQNRPADPSGAMNLQAKLHAAIINGDSGAVQTIKTQMLQLREQQIDRDIAVLQQIAPILTTDQKQQLLKRAGGS
jgi:Spy/CpxP family protein refolding chaperone